MKKALSFILMLTFAVCMISGCKQTSEEAQKVIDGIEKLSEAHNIGTPLDSVPYSLTEVELDYSMLSDEDKEAVYNYDKLTSLRLSYDNDKKEREETEAKEKLDGLVPVLDELKSDIKQPYSFEFTKLKYMTFEDEDDPEQITTYIYIQGTGKNQIGGTREIALFYIKKPTGTVYLEKSGEEAEIEDVYDYYYTGYSLRQDIINGTVSAPSSFEDIDAEYANEYWKNYLT